MLKKTIFSVLTIALAIVVSLSFIANPVNTSDTPTATMEIVKTTVDSENFCCPPGWDLICNNRPGVVNNASKDKNGDECLCRKDLPGNNANGNNDGPASARNWKDNNQPCN